MKKTITVSVLAMLSFGALAKADSPMVDVPTDDQVVQAVEFKGKPGVQAEAFIIKMDESSEPSLLITHQKPHDVRYYAVIDNADLSLNVGGMFGTESTLAVAANGSLKIQQQNTSVGRDRFERTMTVAYRNGKYVVAGFTFSAYDTISATGESCDYNLLTGKGKRDGKAVQIKAKALDLATLKDSEKLYTCKGW